jgi:protoporphyrinogen oxidase
LESGEKLTAENVVVATDIRSARQLLGEEKMAAPVNSVACLYFDAPAAPPTGPILVLNGENSGPINNLSVMSSISPELAPPGRHLISVTVVDREAIHAEDLLPRVQTQLGEWFGQEAGKWEHLRTYHIPEAVPAQETLAHAPPQLAPGRFRCGDYTGVASLDTALASGAQTARVILGS